jgi:hypothetical protein
LFVDRIQEWRDLRSIVDRIGYEFGPDDVVDALFPSELVFKRREKSRRSK